MNKFCFDDLRDKAEKLFSESKEQKHKIIVEFDPIKILELQSIIDDLESIYNKLDKFLS